jgi:hypothetical protein
MVISHQRCKHCRQRMNMPEHTMQCPARPSMGHDWETLSGNGISWEESRLGKLWATKYGKIIIIGFILYVIFFHK